MTSLSIKGRHLNNPRIERVVEDVTTDHIFIKQAGLNLTTDKLLAGISKKLDKIDTAIEVTSSKMNSIRNFQPEHQL